MMAKKKGFTVRQKELLLTYRANITYLAELLKDDGLLDKPRIIEVLATDIKTHAQLLLDVLGDVK